MEVIHSMGLYGSPNLSNNKKTDEEFIICKKCGHEFYKNWNNCPICKTKNGYSTLEIILISLISIIVIAGIYQIIS